MPTQEKQILDWLDDGEWHCGDEMKSMAFLREAVKALKENGHKIEGMKCKLHRDHKSGVYQRRLVK